MSTLIVVTSFHLFHTGIFDIYFVILPLVGWNHIILLYILCPSFRGADLVLVLLLLSVVIILVPGLVPVYDLCWVGHPVLVQRGP